ncbi:MAG: phage tail protein [Candidatus Roseilinea sp.]|jgi:phage tail-like protein|uniref:Phage tail protein n=1 Tax=Candidatus Thermofonsia Clade 3 bacterium TaxID=2364212 RepID=A0A2M8QAV5_9CHLR|nr:phage tail protein [Candidatus Roseilinea sp. NK_OTU-006]PJF46924.1 MAG: phage tail protein [Candidatus Thermofonsia Clade 3 bacterium]RMG63687.1 MAG: phage tail protein [Chloroflexota bacterium]GIV84431.1 MAG: phage tail protein [Candidatus Roseilinea sp.]
MSTAFQAPLTQQDLIEARQTQALLGGARSAGQAFRFYLEIAGILSAEFLECTGLSMERELKEVAEGGVNDFVHKLAGRTKWSNITLRQGISYSRDLWDWYCNGLYDGKVRRVNLSIILGNAELKKVKQWDVFDAFPVRWSGADLSTDTLQVAIESLEIAHHGMMLSREEGNAL